MGVGNHHMFEDIRLNGREMDGASGNTYYWASITTATLDDRAPDSRNSHQDGTPTPRGAPE